MQYVFLRGDPSFYPTQIHNHIFDKKVFFLLFASSLVNPQILDAGRIFVLITRDSKQFCRANRPERKYILKAWRNEERVIGQIFFVFQNNKAKLLAGGVVILMDRMQLTSRRSKKNQQSNLGTRLHRPFNPFFTFTRPAQKIYWDSALNNSTILSLRKRGVQSLEAFIFFTFPSSYQILHFPFVSILI